MTNPTAGRARPPAGPSLNLRGAVDLGALAAPRPAAPTAGNGAAAVPGGFSVDVAEAEFNTAVIETSMTVPVILDFWADWCGPCRQLTPVLESLADEYAGRFLLAKIDVDANQQLAQILQIQSIPHVWAVIKGQPMSLFQGALPEPQVRQALTEVLKVAQQQGVTGQLAGAAAPLEAEQEPEEEPLPPLHQAAYDAIERDDLDAAISAYQQALLESPADDLARVGLAQVQLMHRTRDADPAAARQAAALAPADVEAQILVADLDVLGGHIEDAFSRLVDTVRVTAGDDRDKARKHLVELFAVVGADDPRVAKSRLALANALY